MSEDTGEASAPAPAPSTLELACPECGRITRHRVLRFRSPLPGNGGRKAPRAVQGVARCAECRTVHPFRLERTPMVPIRVIVSEGRTSESFQVPYPGDRPLELEDRPVLRGRPLRILRLEGREGQSLRSARPDEIRAVWAVPGDRVRIPVSIPLGARTRVVHWEVRPEDPVTVGMSFVVAGEKLFVSGYHGGGHREDRKGRSLPALEVKRIYAKAERTGPPVPERRPYPPRARFLSVRGERVRRRSRPPFGR